MAMTGWWHGARRWLGMAAVGLCVASPPSAAEIAVDVGHTLVAPGATSARGRSEFEFNLDLARALVQALEGRGLPVRLINEDGRIPSLQARPQAASGSDFLISVHHDSVGEHELRPWVWEGQALNYNDDFAGHSLFVSRDNPDTARSILCARIIGARLQRMGFVPTHKNGRRRAYADTQHGVIKNRDEELLLRDEARIRLMADGIATGLAACLRNGVPADGEAEADAPS